jgi:hypothetical protein
MYWRGTARSVSESLNLAEILLSYAAALQRLNDIRSFATSNSRTDP